MYFIYYMVVHEQKFSIISKEYRIIEYVNEIIDCNPIDWLESNQTKNKILLFYKKIDTDEIENKDIIEHGYFKSIEVVA